jgi:dolichyl-phosphate-mannose-protein mannosyltransferase
MTKAINRVRWAMVAILLLASAFYLYNLNAISFWEDESWLTIAIGDGVGDVWTFATENGVHPPLYFYIAYFLKPFISDYEYSLRWTAGLIALIGVAFTYRFGTDTVDRRVGLTMALLVVGSIFLMYLARLARQYTLFYTLSVMTFWIYWRWQARPTGRWRWLLILVQTANFYTHYFSAFVAITISLHALVSNPKQSWRVIAAMIGSGLLFLPWLPSILVQMKGEYGTGLDYGTSEVALIIENYLGRVMNANWWLGGAMTLLGIIAIIREKRWKLGLLILIAIGTLIPVILVNQTLFQWYIGRNMLYTLPLVVLLYAIGLAHLLRLMTPTRKKKTIPVSTDTIHRVPTISRGLNFISVVIAVGFVLWGIYVFPVFWPGTADWRGIMKILARDARADDIFVVNGEPYSTDYYLRRFVGERVEILPMRAWWRAENPAISERIWLIDSFQAVRFEAIAAIPDNMLMTRRLVRLPVVAEFYQRVPDEALANFDGQLALGYTDTETITVKRGETLVIDVWWQALWRPDFNYSAAFLLMREGFVLTQVDGNFDSGRLDAQVLPIGTWTPDMRLMDIPDDAPLGEYELRITVYDWRDNTRLAIEPESAENLFTLLTVIIEE